MTLRVAVVTQDEPFYMPSFYRSFFPALDEVITVEWVTILDLLDGSLRDTVARAYRLYGPTNVPRLGIGYVWRRLLDRLGIADRSVASVADANGVPVERRESVNTPAFVRRIEERGIDVLLSVSAPEIFERDLLDAPEWGCLNVHTSELPKYRGLVPTFWALYHGEREIGVTVHTMAEEVDRGRAVRRTTFPAHDASLDEVIQRGKRTGGALAARALGDVARGEETYAPIEGEGSYHSFPTVEDRREFLRRGGELL